MHRQSCLERLYCGELVLFSGSRHGMSVSLRLSLGVMSAGGGARQRRVRQDVGAISLAVRGQADEQKEA